MNFFELVSRRESCRAYSDKPVSRDQLVRMIDTARMAPSACNSQPWHFTAVTGEYARKTAVCTQGLGMNGFTAGVPAFIVISERPANLSAKLGGLVKKQQYAQTDIGIAAAHLCFSASEMGLSTCILGWFDENKLADALCLDKSSRIRLVIAVGYAASDTLRPKKRKPLEEVSDFLE